MTAAEKISAVQTLYGEMTTTKYQGSVAVDCSLGGGDFRAAALAGMNALQGYYIELNFLYNGIVTDAVDSSGDSLLALLSARNSTPYLPGIGFDFTTSTFFSARGGRYVTQIESSQSGSISEGEVHRLVFKVIPSATGDSTTLSITLDGKSALAPTVVAYNYNDPASGASVPAPIIAARGISLAVLSTKMYLPSGQLVSALSGSASLSSPSWDVSGVTGDKLTPSNNVISVSKANAANEVLITLYLNMAAEKILLRLYPFERDKSPTDIPTAYDMTQVELAARLYARAGAEGEISHNENGINRTYKTVDDADILSRIVPYCRTW